MDHDVNAYCDDKFKVLRSDVDSVWLVIRGNGNPGLAEQVRLNTAFRNKAEDIIFAVNKKLFVWLFFQMLANAGLAVYLVEKLGK